MGTDFGRILGLILAGISVASGSSIMLVGHQALKGEAGENVVAGAAELIAGAILMAGGVVSIAVLARDHSKH